MNWTVILRPEATADVQETVADLDQRSAGLGARYVVRLRQVLERLESNPVLYAGRNPAEWQGRV